MFLPVLFYMPETSLGFGAGTIATFVLGDNPQNTRLSSVLISAYYTLKKQYAIEVKPELYFKKDSYFLKAYIGYILYPNKYFGIGNNTPDFFEEDYTPRSLRFDLFLQKKISARLNLFAGIQYRFENFSLHKTDPEGRLAEGKVPGSEGGTLSSFGVTLKRDNRDNIYFPRSGDYYQISSDWYTPAFGSDFRFTRLKFDFRKYIPVFSSHVVAIQVFLDGATGSPPFHLYPLMGGERIMRGYFLGRFRDKVLAVVQTEYRFPITRKLKAALFSGWGQVASSLRSLSPGDVKYTVGLGLRYYLVPDAAPCIRLDFGFGRHTSGFYITVDNAF